MKKITMDAFSEYKFLSDAAFSPNGKNVAFVVHNCDMAENGYQSHIWICNPDSGESYPLTSASRERSFSWLDNETLLFPANREKKEAETSGEAKTDYYTIRLRGGEAQKAFTVPLAVDGIEPLGGSRYLLTAGFDCAAPDFSRMTDAEKSNAAKAQKEEADYQILDEIPYWANGGGFINKKRDRLYLFDAASGECTPITDPLLSLTVWKLNDTKDKVLFAGSLYADRYDLTDRICICDLATMQTEVVVPQGLYSVAYLDFTGDGVLFFGTDMKEYGINENYRVYRVKNGQTEIVTRLTLSSWNSVGSDCRYGGGKTFQLADGGAYFLATDRYTARIRRLLPNGSISFVSRAEGAIDCFDIKNGRCVFIGMREQKLQELYSLNLATGDEVQLTHLNEAALRDKYVAQPQYLPFTNSANIEIDGWVLLPYGYDPAKRYPAILNIHGGPKTVYGTVFYHEMQVWASEGYLVLFCNPRGGDGRGDAFADIRGRYGTVDYDDLMEFVNVVLAAYPAIDPKRLGVTGGSYGGFMTNWIIGHTDRFAAAVSQRSIANWISMSYTTDIGYSFGPDQTAATAWYGVEHMWQQSPLKYADRCKTPTLFLHSEEDYRCWMAEGLQMFTALKVHGVPARLCLFKGENHDLSRSGKPKHRLRRLKEITDWMDKYLCMDKTADT